MLGCSSGCLLVLILFLEFVRFESNITLIVFFPSLSLPSSGPSSRPRQAGTAGGGLEEKGWDRERPHSDLKCLGVGVVVVVVVAGELSLWSRLEQPDCGLHIWGAGSPGQSV